MNEDSGFPHGGAAFALADPWVGARLPTPGDPLRNHGRFGVDGWSRTIGVSTFRDGHRVQRDHVGAVPCACPSARTLWVIRGGARSPSQIRGSAQGTTPTSIRYRP